MESLNLFGMPLPEESSTKDQAAKKRFVADLIDMLADLDDANELAGLGATQDFAKPKAFISYDPSA